MPQTTHDSTTSAGGIPSSCHRFGCVSGCLALRHRIFLLFFCPTHTVPSFAAPGQKEEDDPAQSWRQPSTVTGPPRPRPRTASSLGPAAPTSRPRHRAPHPAARPGPKTTTDNERHNPGHRSPHPQAGNRLGTQQGAVYRICCHPGGGCHSITHHDMQSSIHTTP